MRWPRLGHSGFSVVRWLGPRTRLLLAMTIVAGVALLYQQILAMDSIFFQRSPSGARALVLYLTGDYAGAARAYRGHFRDAVRFWPAGDQASNAIIAGDLDRAERLAREELAANPAAVEPLVALGEIALERAALGEASDAFRRVLTLDPNHLDALMLASVARARAGAHGDAIDLANLAFRHNAVAQRLGAFLWIMAMTGELAARPAPERPLCLLAHYHRYLRIFDTSHARLAARYAEQAVAAGDRVADAHVTIGLIHAKSGRPEQALAAFERASAADPRHAEAYRRASVIYADRGDDVRAYATARAAFEAAPTDPFYLMPLDHIVMERLADPHQAVAVLTRALAANPDNVRAHERLGYAFGFIGDQERSLGHYRRALALEPNNPVHQEGLAWALDRLGRSDDALAAYRQAVTMAPACYQSHVALATAYHRRHQYREAIAEYEAALSLGERSVETLASLCAMYHTTSQFRRAVQCFERVLALDPSQPLALRLMPESQSNARAAEGAR